MQETPVQLDPIDADQLAALVGNYTDKVVLVAFWSSSDGLSMRQFARVVAIADYHLSQPFQLITVCMESPLEQQRIKDFLRASKVTGVSNIRNYVSKYGNKEIAFDDFEIKGGLVPFFRIYDRSGQLSQAFESAELGMDQAIASALATDAELTTLLDASRRLTAETNEEPMFKARPMFDDEPMGDSDLELAP